MDLPTDRTTGNPHVVFDSTGMVFAVMAQQQQQQQQHTATMGGGGHYIHLYDARNFSRRCLFGNVHFEPIPVGCHYFCHLVTEVVGLNVIGKVRLRSKLVQVNTVLSLWLFWLLFVVAVVVVAVVVLNYSFSYISKSIMTPFACPFASLFHHWAVFYRSLFGRQRRKKP